MQRTAIAILVALLLTTILAAQTPGELAGLIGRGDDARGLARALAAAFPRELSAHRQDVLAAIAARKEPADRRLLLAAYLLADPDADDFQSFLRDRIGGNDPGERALALGISGFLPRPRAELVPAVLKAVAASDPASRLEAAIALGRPGFREGDDALKAAALDALEEAFADREEVVALAAARSWALGRPGEKRLEAQRATVRAGRGSKLVGAVLALGFAGEPGDLPATAALLSDKRAGAAAAFALARLAGETRHRLADLVPGLAERKPAEVRELALDLAALGVSLADPIDWSEVEWDATALEALIRRGDEARIGKVKSELAATELVARFLAGEAARQALETKPAQEPPFAAAWRCFAEAERRGGFALAELVPAPAPLDRLLRARFLAPTEQELVIEDPKMAGKFDPARDIWGLAVPLVANRPGFLPTAKYAALAEKLEPLDRMLDDAALAFGAEGETAIVAARAVAVTVIDDALARRDPRRIESTLPRGRGLRIPALMERVYLGLDASPRRLAVAHLFARRRQVAPGLWPALADWAALDRDRAIGRAVAAATRRDDWGRVGGLARPDPSAGSDPERLKAYLAELERIVGNEEIEGDPAQLHEEALLLAPSPFVAGEPALAARVARLLGEPGSDYLQFLLLWVLPEGARGGERAAELRRRLLDEGGGPEATALAAFQIAQGGGEDELPRIRAALESEFRDLPVAALLGLLRREAVPEELRDPLLTAALDTSPLLSVLALECLGRLAGDDQTGFLGVVTANLDSELPQRRIGAARLLEKLSALSVAELLAIGDQLDGEDVGAARLALAIARLGRPDPRLRRKLELATCSEIPEKRVAARLALETLWSGDQSPPETLLEWREQGPVTGSWAELLASVPTPPGPAQIERIVYDFARMRCTWEFTRPEIAEAAMLRLRDRGAWDPARIVIAPDDPMKTELESIARRIGETSARPSEEN